MAGGVQEVIGNTPHDAVNAGNPVGIGGVANDTPPTAVADGDRTNARFDTESRQFIRTEVRERIAAASAARTATGQSADLRNLGGAHMLAKLDITAVSGTTPTLDIQLQAKHHTNTATYRRLAGGGTVAFPQATAAADDDHMHVGPAVTEKLSGTDRHYSAVLPLLYRYEWTIAGTSPSFTFSIVEDWTP